MSIKLNARKHGLPIALGDKRTLKLSAHSIEIAYDKRLVSRRSCRELLWGMVRG